ncbi:MAG: YoaK family protein [Streptococcaceae bacterium]|nr:YoaK family protein [Streptococcaceae bacterium]
MNTLKEKLRIAMLLAINSGFIDGYTYFHFSERFAGMQTGNLIQAGINLANGKIQLALGFALPILFFIVGIGFKIAYSHFLKMEEEVQHFILIQGLGVLAITLLHAFVITLTPPIYIGLLSFFMAIQADTFTNTHGLAYNSVFGTGNIRSFSTNLMQFFLTKDKEKLSHASIYFGLILSFFVGAVFSTLLLNVFGTWTLLGSCFILLIVYLIFVFSKNKKIMELA